MQLHIKVPVAHPTARVIAGPQVLPESQIPELLDLESLRVRIPPELEDGLQLVPLLELSSKEEKRVNNRSRNSRILWNSS